VRGGTGWGAEFAKLCNKPLHVFDQQKNCWERWTGDDWTVCDAASEPTITHPHFTGTGTRTLQDNGRRAIDALFARSFAAAG
jgi:cystathionine beta-lyase family protein involved in aluminum resistance